MPLIHCKDAAFSYEGREVVSGLNFNLEPGDYLCVLGENGAGKSTLVKGLLRLKTPSRGTIAFGSGLSPSQIGYLPQRAGAKKGFPASVFEVVLSGRLNSRGMRPFYTQEDKKLALMNMERMGIAGLGQSGFSTLSGGQQQRALLARALCATHSLLVLDEPTAGLDTAAARELYTLISSVNREAGIAVIMVTHDVPEALRQGKHILCLACAQAFYGTAREYSLYHGTKGEAHAE